MTTRNRCRCYCHDTGADCRLDDDRLTPCCQRSPYYSACPQCREPRQSGPWGGAWGPRGLCRRCYELGTSAPMTVG